MPIKTKRWDELRERDDGFRLLICRYRPRGLPKEQETWDAWEPDLAPSRELHAAAYGKGELLKLSWDVYRARYLKEMLAQKAKIAALAERVRQGEAITLLCSSACEREARCHRSLLRALIERAASENAGP